MHPIYCRYFISSATGVNIQLAGYWVDTFTIDFVQHFWVMNSTAINILMLNNTQLVWKIKTASKIHVYTYRQVRAWNIPWVRDHCFTRWLDNYDTLDKFTRYSVGYLSTVYWFSMYLPSPSTIRHQPIFRAGQNMIWPRPAVDCKLYVLMEWGSEWPVQGGGVADTIAGSDSLPGVYNTFPRVKQE